jgi:hypothetical protein
LERQNSNNINVLAAEEYGSPLKLIKMESSNDKVKKGPKITPIDELEQSLRKIIDNQYFDPGQFEKCNLQNLNFTEDSLDWKSPKTGRDLDENHHDVAFSPLSNFSE